MNCPVAGCSQHVPEAYLESVLASAPCNSVDSRIRTAAPRQDATTMDCWSGSFSHGVSFWSRDTPRTTFPQLPMPPKGFFTGPWVLGSLYHLQKSGTQTLGMQCAPPTPPTWYFPGGRATCCAVMVALVDDWIHDYAILFFLYRCRRREDTQCSPSEGPCCNNRCRFISKWEKIKCKGNQDCTKASFCDGNQAQCPIPAFKEDNVTECNEGTQVRMLEIFFTNKKNELNYVVVLL